MTRSQRRPATVIERWGTSAALGIVLLLLLVGGFYAGIRWWGPQATAAEAAGQPVSVPGMTLDGDSSSCVVPAALTADQLRDQSRATGLRPTAVDTSGPAEASLGSLARALTPSACDRQAGRDAYIAVLHWTLDGAVHAGKSRNGLALTQYRTWRAADGSGRIATTSTRQPESDEMQKAGALSGYPWQIPAAADSPQSAMSVIADVNRCGSPDLKTRASAIRLLISSGGLTFHGQVLDRAGRAGLGYSVTNERGQRDLIILSQRTGELLAYEQAAMRDPGALGIKEPTILSYQLFLIHTHVSGPATPTQ